MYLDSLLIQWNHWTHHWGLTFAIVSTQTTGKEPLALSPDNMTQSAPSRTALATSDASARVGRDFFTILSNICRINIFTSNLTIIWGTHGLILSNICRIFPIQWTLTTMTSSSIQCLHSFIFHISHFLLSYYFVEQICLVNIVLKCYNDVTTSDATCKRIITHLESDHITII